MMQTDYRSLSKGYNKAKFYIGNFFKYAIPNVLYNKFFIPKSNRLTDEELSTIRKRTDYYNRLNENSPIDNEISVQVRNFKYPFGKKRKFSAYFFDLYENIRCFNPEFRFHYVFGDIDHETLTPSFVKSRPVVCGHTNSVICKLNKVRHFRFIQDTNRFQDKKNLIVFRNIVKKQPQRTKFLELYAGHSMCNAGQINNDHYDDHPEFVKPYLSIEEQLKYKFIACIEGHDVATNLKWVMSSNSLAVMPRPKIESWFMEGTLVPDYHYVEIKEDYSDLIEKMEYYIAHPEEAEAIINHAHEYIRQFQNPRMEKLITLSVIEKYFRQTGQM